MLITKVCNNNNMFRRTTNLVIFISLAILFLVPGVFETLFALVFIGIIPFIDYTIPPLFMLVFYGVLIAIGIYWIVYEVMAITRPPKKKPIKSRKTYTKKKKSVVTKRAKKKKATASTSVAKA